MSKNLGVLISGRGSNFENIQKKIEAGALEAQICCVISNKKTAGGLEIAAHYRIPSYTLNVSEFESFEKYEQEIVRILKEHKVDWVILAGYLRMVKKNLLQAFPNKILNIHPSLLPAFKGLNAQEQALAAGVKVAGCTVHFVNEDLDSGKIVGQKALQVLEDDTVESLSSRILTLEHQLYPEAIQAVIKNTL